MNKIGVLLINLGTPDNCDAKSIRKYLREFLMDARVITLPAFIRWSLVNLFILPFRYKQTTAAYQKIWTAGGSPLLANSRKIQAALASELGEEYQVELGMRYGHPDIHYALNKLNHCSSITVIPLFPQYSSAASGSAMEKLFSQLSQGRDIPELFIKKDFYHHPGFIQAYANLIRTHIQNNKVDKLIFSYHGLPSNHIIKSTCKTICDQIHPCPVDTTEYNHCYRAQCYTSSKLIAEELELSSQQYIVAFQSRLGSTPWIKPYTDYVLKELIQEGVTNVAIVSPSFVADCLETLEEINIRAREQWVALGGKNFIYIPCINDDKLWIKSLAESVSKHYNS